MNKFFQSISIMSILFLFGCTANEIKEEDGPRERMLQDIEMMKDPALGYVPTDRLLQAKLYKDRMLKTRAALSGVDWTELGPNNQGGRSRAMLIDANDVTGNTVWVGSVGGGIWKTTDITAAAPNWTIADNFFSNLAVTSIAQETGNPAIMYFATGEGYGNGDAIQGAGVWKSTDGGVTWNQLPSTNNSTFNFCQRVACNAAGTLFVATNSGLYRSVNGGTTFNKVLGTGLGITGASSNTCSDVEFAANGDIYGTLDGSIHKSTDDGVTFNAAMTLPVTATRIEVACAPSDANYAYVLIENGSAVNGIARTVNGGTSWVLRTEPADADPGIGATDFSRGQAWYDLTIAVDPNNRDALYVGGVDLFKSTDGAGTWTQVAHWYGGFGFPYVHADQHLIQYAPGSSNVIYFCNDGGIFRTTDGNLAAPTMVDKGTNYVTTQFYGCAIHPTALTSYFLAGAQDNGSHQYTSAALQSTIQVTGGDGAFCNIDQNEPQYQWTQYVFNEYYRSTDGGSSWTNVASSGGRFINPTDYDDVNNRMYAARNNNQYSRWDNPQSGSTFVTVNAASFGGQVSAVKVSPNTNNRVFFGIGTGDVFRVDNAHTGAPVITSISTGLPNGFAACVEVENGNDNHLLVTYSNYGVNSIWESTNGGTSWTSVEGNMPDMPVRWALFNPNNSDQAVVATELGVWSTDNLNGGATVWGPSNSGLANVRVDQLQYRTSDNLMIASTHGRGLFSSDAFTSATALFEANKLTTYIGANIQFTDNSYASTSWLWDFGDGNTSNLENPVHAYANPGKYDVTLTINGVASTLTKTQYIHILPNKGTPYTPADGGNFETNADDFGANNTIGTPWERGTCVLAGKNGNFSPTNTWVTGLTVSPYADNSDVSLMTPNYNFTLPGIYTILFYKKNVFEIGFDGFRVEYTLDKGTTWTPLGTTGPSWYDFSNAGGGTAFPMGEPFFNSTSAAFVQKSLDISFLAGNPNVAFRLRFKSDVNTVAAGVAIDNFEIQSSVVNDPLPLHLEAFTVREQNGKALLDWVTKDEKNFSHFEVERSFDARNFTIIKNVEAKNQAENVYQLIDDLSLIPVLPDIIYYRLKMVDDDGKFGYSQTGKIVLKAANFESSISPNPFTNFFTVNANQIIKNIRLFDLNGLEILNVDHPMNANINVSDKLPAGMYIVQMQAASGKVYYKKIVKK